MSLRRLGSACWLVLLGLAACSGCSEEGPTAPPDRGSPLIEVRFPTSATAFDRDSNGLVDFDVAFNDSLSGIDVGSIEILANRPVKGPAGQGANLFQVWRVVRTDTTGFVLEETVDNLLPRGRASLTVAVRDRAGNRVSRTFTVELPPAARHKVLDLGAVFKVNTSQVTIGPDGTKAYVTTEEFGGSALSIVDLERLELLSVARSPIDALAKTAVDEARGLLYLVSIDEPLVAVFDLASETFQAPIATSDRGVGVALSPQRDRLYVGLETVTENSGAFISVIDVAARHEEQVFDLSVMSDPRPEQPVQMAELLLDPAENRVFATTWVDAQAGILVFDPDTGGLLQQVDLEPENPPRLGGALDIDWLDGELIVTSVNIDGFGLLRVLSGSPTEVTRVSVIEQFLQMNNLVLSPDHSEIAVTTADQGAGSHGTLLLDAVTHQVIWEDRFSGEIVSPQDVEFRPDGNALLVAGGTFEGSFGPAPSELTIYIHR